MKTVGKILKAIAGLAFFFLGIWAIAQPDETFTTIAAIWPILFLVGGVASIVAFFSIPKDVHGRGFILFEGILSIVVGIMMLSNGVLFNSIVLINMLQMWLIFSAISNIVSSFEDKEQGVDMWWLKLILGILLLIISFSSFSGVFQIVGLSISLGIGLIISGVSIFVGVFEPERK